MRQLFFILILFWSFYAYSQPQHSKSNKITFQLFSPDLSNESAVFITGSIPELGNWNPSAIQMNSKGNHLWEKTIETKAAFGIEYKFTLGSWEKESVNANGLPLDNFIVKVASDSILKNDVYFWKDGTLKNVVGQITGSVKYHRNFKGKNLLDRDIIVWLPPNYNNNERYDVLYMHDGQNLFDPRTSSFGVDWRIDETIDSLITSKKIKPLIVVGIYNTKDRSSEYLPAEMGKDYMQFIVYQLKPFIDKNYSTKSGRKHTSVGGSSMGGIISFALVWEYPRVFSKAICMSPAFKINHIDYVKEVTNYTGKKKKIKLYIDNGGIGLEEQLQPGIDDMLKALEQKAYFEGTDLLWIHDKNAKHFEAAWAKRMPFALQWLLGK
ncbi:MAG: alpha/beta hydrolase-fold protein [Flavobacteriaceae bacterium]|nr:alpha/beta hydrolase-fold protein [Flavobacteriaceae bacterium]